MTETVSDFSLKPYNTFGIEVKTSFFAEIHSLPDLEILLNRSDLNVLPWFILGGGSNILFTKDFEGLVIKNSLKGIAVVKETDNEVWIKAASGELWHDLVKYCVAKNYGGIENLSLIPGTVGAAPIQNIGAYGVELKDVFDSLTAIDLTNNSMAVFNQEQCRFGYRDSIFKKEAKGVYFISSVTLKLQKHPVVNTSYGAIQKLLDARSIATPTVADISSIVCEIRNTKLPNPAVIGNAGSFFKNPEVTLEQYQALKANFPAIAAYPVAHGMKLSAGWLIESCDWKGKRNGDAGTHIEHALVLVNYGHAKGADILALAAKIQSSVMQKFGIALSPEVNIL